MSKKQMNYNYMYKGQKKSQNTGYEKYTPGTFGKVVMAITLPSAILAVVSVFIAVAGVLQAITVTFFTCIIAFIGSILIAIDIVRFNRKQKKITDQREEPKEMDIMRIVHLLIGIVVGIAIGYLIWGAKYK